jgi:hypothetical protein
MKPRSLATPILLLIGCTFTIVGIVAGLVFGKPILDNAKASEDWPQTQGEVIESELEESRGDNGTMYSAHVVYRFALDGGDFESNRIWFGGDYSTSNRSEMFEVVKKYPVGQTVTVYYSPDTPSESVLMPGAYASSYVLFAIVMVFLGVGGSLLLGFVFLFVRSATGFTSEESQFRDAAFDDFEQIK